MFLALHEMKYEKLRYSLIIAVISLITFLIFIISALALGLANENTDAINSWQTKSVLLTKDSNGNMGQSLMTPEELDPYMNDNHQAIVGITPMTLKDKNHNESIQFVGLRSDEYIAKELQLNSGKKPTQKNEVLISDKLTHYQIGDKIQLGLDSHKYTISGIFKHAQYNMAPVVYGAISNWSAIKGVNPQYLGSGVISKNDQSLTTLNDNFKVLGKSAYLDKLPGYAAQNSTFAFMIIFLILISLIVVTIFLYILTIQKRPNLAVLRAPRHP
ncbi:ABC transporter permease [Weissella minor]|uniref:ABC transporter permease n=1 Tax=Weissella minor TaxID=1620 RepID=UPI002012992D|nr:ABC transporter permease [Weissella minor]